MYSVGILLVLSVGFFFRFHGKAILNRVLKRKRKSRLSELKRSIRSVERSESREAYVNLDEWWDIVLESLKDAAFIPETDMTLEELVQHFQKKP